MTRISPLRIAATLSLVALALPGCARFIDADPLNRTTSIVNGSQVTRGPSRGGVNSGFADIAPPGAFGTAAVGTTFEPAIGEAFDVEELGGLSNSDMGIPELQSIDFGSEQAGISSIITTDTQLPGSSLAQIGQTVYFATDSSDLNDRARETLRRQAAWLNLNPSARITIEGHADERGTREYNLALGDRRATATRGYLIAVGVDGDRIDKTSFGKERPVALSSNERSWAQNRRTETVLDANGQSFSANPPGTNLGGSTPFDSAQLNPGLITTTIEAPPAQPIESTFAPEPFISGTSDSLVLDPLYPAEGTTALIAPPNSVNYETTSGLFPPAGQAQVYNGGSIAPTVFDSPIVTSSAPAPVFATSPSPVSVSSVPVTGTTRIEDVSVDDLLRDPSLIDRIGTPAATTPGS